MFGHDAVFLGNLLGPQFVEQLGCWIWPLGRKSRLSRSCIQVQVGGVVQIRRHWPALLPPAIREVAVRQDLEKPGPKIGTGLERIEGTVSQERRLLHQV